MEENIIKLNFGGRYQIISGELYSLNYAEKGMTGSSMGKKLPEELAKQIMEQYEARRDYEKARAARPRPKKEIKVQAKPKAEEKKKFKRKKTRTIGTSVKLSDLLK